MMRLRAPAISGAAVVLAVALVWHFRPAIETPLAADHEATPERPVPVANKSSAPAVDAETRANAAPPPTDRAFVERLASAAPGVDRARLPGETPTTPMAGLVAGLPGGGPRVQLVEEGEREFAREPVDRAWAPSAEADIFAKLPQAPGLELIDLQVECRSTMCRLQLMQPSGIAGGSRPFITLLDSIGLEPRWMVTTGERGTGPIKSVAYLWRDGFASPKPVLGQSHETQ